MSFYHKRGGLHFLRLGRLHIQWSWVKPRPMFPLDDHYIEERLRRSEATVFQTWSDKERNRYVI